MSISSILKDRRLWLVVAAIGGFLLLRWSGVASYLSLDTLKTHRETLTNLVKNNFLLASLGYVALYIAATAFSCSVPRLEPC
jgi:hypothetical protein